MSSAPIHEDNPQAPAPSIERSSVTQSETQPPSGVRFEDGRDTHRWSTATSQRALLTSHEDTPIRQASSASERNYNTTSGQRPSPATDSSSSSDGRSQKKKSESKPNLLKRIIAKCGSVSLENKASVARDHLALERTFLAWLRTSLAFASIGIGITQLFRLNTSTSGQSSRKHRAAAVEGSRLSLSPFIGHSVPFELAPYLQQPTGEAQSFPTPAVLGSTLLDQLLLLSPDGARIDSSSTGVSAIHATKAANPLKGLGKPLGATFIGIAILVLMVGFHRYFEAQYWIMKGKFPASRGSITLITLTAFALILSCLISIVVIEDRQR